MTNTAFLSYVPADRLLALARGETLPDRVYGTALFADISGFTPLTEKLTRTLGTRRGVEELTLRLNTVYDALIGEIECYSGSVISFAGDAITCWFDVDPQSDADLPLTAAQAVAAAQAIQKVMVAFEGLAVKVTVSTGPARRFAVGRIPQMDALAGATIARLATAEHLAEKGEILVDQATVAVLAGDLTIAEWRGADGSDDGERFAVVGAFNREVAGSREARPAVDIPDVALKPWLLPAIYEREQSGHGEFLTELRPTVSLFLRFSGIDYDGDEQAGDKLDSFISRMQEIITAYDGALFQLTIGDKGSYCYASFGAPVVHENDPYRAVQAALELSRLPQSLTFLQPLQIGVTRGTTRTGTYGSQTRRIYSGQGDKVNLAARLMTQAAPGEVLVSQAIQAAVASDFAFKAYPPTRIKGKAEPQLFFGVTRAERLPTIRLMAPSDTLPLVGRQEALALIDEKLKLTSEGKGQIIGITAEAGMGKSRLAAEAVRLARERGFTVYGGACQSSGTNTPYLVWKSIWQAFFDLDDPDPVQQSQRLGDEIARRAPARVQAIPVLSPLLDIAIEENDFTRALEPKDRRNVLAAVLEDCLKSKTTETPMLLVLEDLHWIDPLSYELLESLARMSVTLPVCFLLAYRPADAAGARTPRIESLPHFNRLTLDQLSPAEVELLIEAKLAQLFPEHRSTIPKALAAQVTARAEGNPFYVEELLTYLRDRGISPYDEAALQSLELPASLHALILSRIDQLSEGQEVTLKTASIIGRMFAVAWLHGYYPPIGEPEQVKAHLTELARLDLTPQDSPEPEPVYLFKHAVTQEVAYESLTYGMRVRLHEKFARFIEGQAADKYLDLLAYHYSRSENAAKQRQYLDRAGKAAEAAFANHAALDYYARLLPLLTEPGERADLYLRQGSVMERVGRWDEAEQAYRNALAQATGNIAAGSPDPARTARSQKALGALHSERGDYPAAREWLQQARQGWIALENRLEQGRTLSDLGWLYLRTNDYPSARAAYEEALTLLREVNDQPGIAAALNRLGVVLLELGDYPQAQALIEQSLGLWRQLANKPGIAASLHNLAYARSMQGDYPASQALYEETLALRRETADKKGIAAALNNLANVLLEQGNAAAARPLYEEALLLRRELGEQFGVATTLFNLGSIALSQGGLESLTAARAALHESLQLSVDLGIKSVVMYNFAKLAAAAIAQPGAEVRAARLLGAAEGLRAASGTVMELSEREVYERTLATARGALGEAAFSAQFEAGQKLTFDEAVQYALEDSAPA
jgi:predicted ATPase/class 3 adenylate cyclase